MNAISEFYTPQEVADILKVSRDTVLRKFSSVPGVIDLGTPDRRALRIPHAVLHRFIVESRVA